MLGTGQAVAARALPLPCADHPTAASTPLLTVGPFRTNAAIPRKPSRLSRAVARFVASPSGVACLLAREVLLL